MRSISELFSKLITLRKATDGPLAPPATMQPAANGIANDADLPERPEFEDNAASAAPVDSSADEYPAESSQTGGKQTTAAAPGNFPLYEIGDLIAGRYRVRQRLEGAVAYLYVAYDKIDDIDYAVKQPKQAVVADPVFSSRILKAANAWIGLGMHPHIVHCYFVRQIGGVPLLFAAYAAGGNLRHWIETGLCAELRVSLDLAIQFCHGMEHAHGCDVIHQRIKPENILISQAGVLQISDFAISLDRPGCKDGGDPRSDDVTQTPAGRAPGALAYLAPEQLREPALRCAAVPEGVWYESDVYSFGVCLWEMIVGHLPYEEPPQAGDVPPDPHTLRSDVPDGLSALLRDVVARERGKRPGNFAILRKSLNGIYRALFEVDAPGYTLELPEGTAADELNNLGCEYLQRNETGQARSCFESAMEKGLTHPFAAYNLSLMRWRAGEISEDEVLWRLEYCKSDDKVDRRILAELIAQIQSERLDPHSAQQLLADHPGRYEALFGDQDVGQARCLRTLEGHRGWINGVALSTDGSKGLSGSDDRTVKLWNLANGDCLRTLEGHRGRVNAVALSPDGDWGLSGSDDRTLCLWDLEAGTNTLVLKGHESEVTSLAWSADRRLALSGSKDNTLVLWDLQAGEMIRVLAGHTGWVRSVAMTPDGHRALSGGGDNILRFWDLRTGRCIRSSEEHVRGIKTVALGDDGRTGLCGSRDGTLCLWNLETGERLRTFEGHTLSVESVALTADLRWALSASRDTTLRLWELETGQCVQVKKGRRGFVLCVATTPDGQRVLSGNHDNTMQLWDLPLQRRYRAPFRIAAHRSSAGGRETVAADRQAAIAAAKDQQDTVAPNRADAVASERPAAVRATVTRRKQQPQEPAVDAMAATGQVGTEEAAVVNRPGASPPQVATDDTTRSSAWAALREAWEEREFAEDATIVRRYRRLLAGGRATSLLDARALRRLTGSNRGFFAVAQSRDGRRALSGNADASLTHWDLQTGERLHTLRGHQDIVSAVAMTPDGRLALSASADSTLRLWDLAAGECLCVLGEIANAYLSVAITPDGRWALAGQRFGLADESGLLSLWELETRAPVRVWEGHKVQVGSVALTADARWGLSGGADNAVRLWDLTTFENVHVLRGHTQAVNAVAMTPDGRWGFSGSHDTTLRLWDLQTGACVRELGGHTEAVRSVAMSSDGRCGLSGSFDKSLRLWNLATGDCLDSLQQHTGYVTCVDLSLDAYVGLSASMDNTLIQWRFIRELEFPQGAVSN